MHQVSTVVPQARMYVLLRMVIESKNTVQTTSVQSNVCASRRTLGPSTLYGVRKYSTEYTQCRVQRWREIGELNKGTCSREGRY